MNRPHYSFGKHSQLKQDACWCQPLLTLQHEGHVPSEQFPALVWHRPDPGHVFWEHGEQGPWTNTQLATAFWRNNTISVSVHAR